MSRTWIPTSLFLPLLFLSIVTLAAARADAAFVNLGPAGDFNDFVFHDNTQSGSDAEGRVAVGGNAYLGSFTVASSMGSGTDNLIVGGNASNSGTLFNGGLLVNGDVNWASPSITGRVAVNGNATFTGGGSLAGPVSVVGTYTAPGYFPPNTSNVPTPLPFDFFAVKSYLTSESAYLATLPVGGTTTISFNQVHLQASNPLATYVSFDVTGAEMAGAAGAGLYIDAPAGATVVVNVSGAVDSMMNMGIFLSGGVDREHVLYNFYEATSLTLSGIGIEGSILASLADVNFANGNINGTLIANNLTGGGESHLHLFQGTLPVVPVPEPSTLVLAALGLVAVMGMARRRK